MKNQFIENAWPCHIPERSLDEPLLVFDFPEIIGRIKKEDAWIKGDRNAITLLKSFRMRIVLILLKGLAEINFHHSGNLASVQILEGEVNFQMDKKDVLLKKGSLLTLHEEMEHTLIASEESVLLLTIAVGPESQGQRITTFQ